MGPEKLQAGRRIDRAAGRGLEFGVAGRGARLRSRDSASGDYLRTCPVTTKARAQRIVKPSVGR